MSSERICRMMWSYAVWDFRADDWLRSDDGVVWTANRLKEAIAKSKQRGRSVVLSFYGEAAE